MSLEPSTAEPLDPALLVAFRQQAGAVLAQERGMTPAGRVKLSGIARQLGIGEDQIEAAIRSLGEAAAPPAPANPLVEKFRRRLRKDLAGKSRIIGPTIEAQIVAAAQRKYGLDEAASRQTLAEVAAELGLQRISHSQAIDSLAEQIDQAAGEATWLAKEAWDRLRFAGGKWGIELELVDQLIDEKLTANKAQRNRRTFAIRATLVGTCGSIAAVLVGLGLLAMYRTGPVESPSTLPEVAAPTALGPKPGPAATAAPAWWDVDLAIAVDNARKFNQVEPLYPALASPTPAARAGAYRKLAELTLAPTPQPGFGPALASVLAGCYALEADEAAAGEVLASLLSLVPATDGPLPKSRTEYETAYFAGHTLVRLYDRPGLSEARRQHLETMSQRALGLALAGAPTAVDRERAARIAVTRRLFAQLTAAAPREPAQAAVLFGYLADLAYDLSDEEFSRLEATYVASALPAAGKDWRLYQDAAVRAIRSPDPLSALKMLDSYQRVTDAELKQHLAQLLILRVGVQPKSWEPIDVVAAVRKGLGISGSAAVTAGDRWQLLRLRIDAALARPTPKPAQHAALLEQTVELAHLTTLAMALAQGDAGNAVFDASIDQPPQMHPLELPGDEEPAAPAPVRRLPPPVNSRDRQALERWITLVGNFARQEQVQRESNLRGLAQLSERLPDLTPQEAAKVAEYLLAEKTEEELQVALESLGAMRRWKRLRLAIADGLVRSQLTPEQRRQVAGAITEDTIFAEDATADALRLAILQSVQRELDGATPAGASADGEAGRKLDRAAELLTETYRARARLLSVSPSSVLAADSPAEALVLSLDPLAASLRAVAEASDAQYLARLPYEANAWGYVCESDLTRTVAIQRTLSELLARRTSRLRPTQAAAAQQIAVELSSADLAAANALVQLRHHEAAALQLWMLHAPQL